MTLEVKPDLETLQYAQRERLAYIDYCLQYVGKVSRTSLVKHFNVGLASCSRDFKIYLSLAPNNLTLKHTDKFYYRTNEFNPLFKQDPHSVLVSLANGFGDGFSNQKNKATWVFDNLSLIAPDTNIVATLTRAIIAKHAVKLTYQSLTSGQTSRVIIPHSLINNGHRWHVRAFDRNSNMFKDFVCTRIEALQSDDSDIAEHEQKYADSQWQSIVHLVLVPHPTLIHKQPIELDYAMINGERKIEIQAALAGYLMRFWNVDCTANASLKQGGHHLWLKNVSDLKDLNSMTISPGYPNFND